MYLPGSLPKLRMDARVPLLYLEHAYLHVENSCVICKCADEQASMAVHGASYSIIIMGPGCTITRDAAILLGKFNTLVLWCASDGMSVHNVSTSCTYDIKNAKRQVQLIERDRFKLWNSLLDERGCKHKYSENYKELLLLEAAFMKQQYSVLAREHGVQWNGRIPRIRDMDEDDTLNRAITMCNMALYGIATSIIYGLGFLPQFGIVHGRGSTPLAYDISDVFKCKTAIPCAMNHVKNNAAIDRKQLMAELCERCETIPSQMVDLLNRLFLRA